MKLCDGVLELDFNDFSFNNNNHTILTTSSPLPRGNPHVNNQIGGVSEVFTSSYANGNLLIWQGEDGNPNFGLYQFAEILSFVIIGNTTSSGGGSSGSSSSNSGSNAQTLLYTSDGF